MAYANLQTGAIRGAEKGTRKYYHEEGHLKYDETKFGQIVRTIQDFSLDALITFSALGVILQMNLIKILVALALITRFVSVLLEEQECWTYARLQLKKLEVQNVGVEKGTI